MVATVVGRQWLRRGERHDAEGEVQAVRGGDDGGSMGELCACQEDVSVEMASQSYV